MAGFESASNVYVPSFEASGKLQIEYSRNPNTFSCMKYTKVIPVKQNTGYYLQINTDAAARLLYTTGEPWADGAEAPNGDWFKAGFTFPKFLTTRYATAFNIGQMAVDFADWNIKATYARMAAQSRMTYRAQTIVTALTTSGNWGGNTDTCTNLVGGKLDVSTTSLNYIKKLQHTVADLILKATIGAVRWPDLLMVMNPVTARLIGVSGEIVDWLKQSPASAPWVLGKQLPGGAGEDQTATWGLPNPLFNMNIVIEDAIKVTTPSAVTPSTKTYILGDGTIYFVSRPGGLLGSEGVPDFSTVQCFVQEDMTVETMNDPNNRRVTGRVVDAFGVEVAAPATGYLVTACTG